MEYMADQGGMNVSTMIIVGAGVAAAAFAAYFFLYLPTCPTFAEYEEWDKHKGPGFIGAMNNAMFAMKLNLMCGGFLR